MTEKIQIYVLIPIFVIMFAVQIVLQPPAPLPRILDLELAGETKQEDHLLAECIVDAWKSRNVANRAEKAVYWDFGFIASYVALLGLGAWQSGSRLAASWGKNGWKAAGVGFILIALLAGSLDVVEDLGLLAELERGDFSSALRTYQVTLAKFLLIGIVAAFWFLTPLAAMAHYAITHVALTLLVVLLYGFIYGILGTSFGIALLFWNDDWWNRFFAAWGATLLILQIGVIVYYDQRDVAGGLVDVMVGRLPADPSALSHSVNLDFLGKFLVNNAWGFLILLAAPAIDPRSFYNLPPIPADKLGTLPAIGPWGGAWLLGIVAGVGVAVLLLSLCRLVLTWGGMADINVADHRPAGRYFLGVYVLIYSFMATAMYHVISPALAICTLIGVATQLYSVVIYFPDLLPLIPRRSRTVGRLFLGGVLLALVTWANNDSYKLQLPGLAAYYPPRGWRPPTHAPDELDQACPPGSAEIAVPLRALVREHYLGDKSQPTPGDITPLDDEATLNKWLDQVAPRPADGPRPRPKLAVVVVSGGATRSAYWSANVLDRIEEPPIIPDFARYVRIIAGASGGMVGAALSLEELRKRVDASAPHQRVSFRSTIRTNSLEPLVRYIAFRELWHALVPVRWKTDRGIILEDDWAEIKKPFFVDYRKFEADGKIPSMIVSPMIVDDGRRLLISNLDLRDLARTEGGAIGGETAPEDPGTRRHLYSLTALEFTRLFPYAREFTLATAVRINASFPYVSPAVNLPTYPPRRVVDAGYYDNYGVQIGAAWIESHVNWLLDHTSGVVLVQVRDAISLEDRYGVTDDPGGIFGTIGRGFQFFTSPIDGIDQARYTVSAFSNDQDVEGLSELFTDRLARRLAVDAKDEAKVAALRDRARPFFTTVIFENSTMVVEGKPAPGSWPGDSIEGVPAANDVSLDWYLSQAERDGLDSAIPAYPTETIVQKAVVRLCDPRPSLPTGALLFDPADPDNTIAAGNRGERMAWIWKQVDRNSGDRRKLWIKALEQASNFERLLQLKRWWSKDYP